MSMQGISTEKSDKVYTVMSVLDLCLKCAVTGLNENPMQKKKKKVREASYSWKKFKQIADNDGRAPARFLERRESSISHKL